MTATNTTSVSPTIAVEPKNSASESATATSAATATTATTTTTAAVNSAIPKDAHIAVIGAGPAGLSCAYELVQLGYHVDLFEMNAQVGGMSRSIDVLGQRADVGPHRFFSKYDVINDFWGKFLPSEDRLLENRLSRIFYRNKFFSYPLKGFEALWKLGFIESTRCFCSYLYANIFPRKEHTFEAWVSNAFGHRLYQIFFKTYSEKLWGIKCSELSDLFAKQRIKSLNLVGAIKNALFTHGHSKDVPTLIDQFVYPKQGCGSVYENLTQQFISAGGRLYSQEKVIKLLTEEHHVTGLVSQKVTPAADNKSTNAPSLPVGEPVTRHYDAVVSSAILTEMLDSMSELSSTGKALAKKIRFRNTILVYLTVAPEQAQLPPDHWLYIHSPDIKSGRTCDAANWSSYMQNGHNEHLLCFEYWANDDDELWLSDDEQLIAIAQTDACKMGFIPATAIKEGFVHRIYKSYPIYHSQYEEIMQQLIPELETFANLYFIGRNGAARYNNMDHSIFMGLMCARKIAGKYDDSLWKINTDSDYQECMTKHAK